MFKKIFKYCFLTGLALGTFGLVSGVVMYNYFSYDLPDVKSLEKIELSQPLRIYDSKGKLLADYGSERRLPLEFEQFPDYLVEAIVAVEDRRFYEHYGIDPYGMARAVYVALTTGKVRQGASTITQQVARNFFLNNKRELIRKIKEIILSLKMERELTKEQILNLYMNKIYLGNRTYGFASAAYTYFSKKVNELTLSEAALLAGVQQSPSRLNPIANYDASINRRNVVLRAMLETNKITQEQYEQAKAEKIVVNPGNTKTISSYITELARQALYNSKGEEIYNSGYKIYLTIDSADQNKAIVAVRNNLLDYDKRHGWRGVQEKLFEGNPPAESILLDKLKKIPRYEPIFPVVVLESSAKKATVLDDAGQRYNLDLKSVSWAGKYIDEEHKGKAPRAVSDILSPGDMVYISTRFVNDGFVSTLEQIPEVNSGLASLDVRTGAIKALVGGWSYDRSVYNRATQAAIQVGSTIKPFIYANALENGYSWATVVNDAPIAIRLPNGKVWRPANYGHSYKGDVTLRQGMAQSRNTVVVKLSRDLGIDNVGKFITRFGFDPDSFKVTNSLVLGTANFTPLEMARAYAVFDNGGFLIDPYLIERIEDSKGNLVYEANPKVACPTCSDIPSIYYGNTDGLVTTQTNVTDVILDTALAEQKAAQINKEVDQRGILESEKRDKVNEIVKLIDDGANKPKTIQYAPRILSPQVAYLMSSGLNSNVYGTEFYNGTGSKAASLGRKDIGGKTGTTNDSRSAWFVGYAGPFATALYVAFDDNKQLGSRESGGKTALPAWIEFERYQLAKIPFWPNVVPPGIVKTKIDPKTGYLSISGYDEYFAKGTEPTMTAPKMDDDGNISTPKDLNSELF